jgi:hypothetical protein
MRNMLHAMQHRQQSCMKHGMTAGPKATHICSFRKEALVV